MASLRLTNAASHSAVTQRSIRIPERVILYSHRLHGQAHSRLGARTAQRLAAAASRGVQQDDSESEDEDWDALEDEEEDDLEAVHGPPAVFLAGFYLEELAGVRVMLDRAGGQGITLIPSTPTLLRTPLEQALKTPEPRWEEEMPADWVHGGGWGTQRMVLFSGLGLQAQGAIVELLAASQMGEIAPVVATTQNAGRMVGDVLAEAFQAYRRASADSGPGGSPQQFVDRPPPIDRVIPREALEEMGLGEEALGAEANGANRASEPKTLEQLLEELGGGWEMEEGEDEVQPEGNSNGKAAASESMSAGAAAAGAVGSSGPQAAVQAEGHQRGEQSQQAAQQLPPPPPAEASSTSFSRPAPATVEAVEADAVLRPEDVLSKYTPAEVAAAASWARVAAEVMEVKPWVAVEPGGSMQQAAGEQLGTGAAAGSTPAATPLGAVLQGSRTPQAEVAQAEEAAGEEQLDLIDRLVAGEDAGSGVSPAASAAAPGTTAPLFKQQQQPESALDWPWQQQQQQSEAGSPKPAPAVTPDQILASRGRQAAGGSNLSELSQKVQRRNLAAGLWGGAASAAPAGPAGPTARGGTTPAGREGAPAAASAEAARPGSVGDRGVESAAEGPLRSDALAAGAGATALQESDEELFLDLGQDSEGSVGMGMSSFELGDAEFDSDEEGMGLEFGGSSSGGAGAGSESSQDDLRAYTRKRTSGLEASASKGAIPGARTMTKAELREVAAKHGLSFEQLLEDARARGIELPD